MTKTGAIPDTKSIKEQKKGSKRPLKYGAIKSKKPTQR